MDNQNKESTADLENPDAPAAQKSEGAWAFILEIIKFAVIAAVIVVPIRSFVAQPFIVKGESMDPTFEDGQYLIVDEITYRQDPPERGDVIIFKYPKDPSKYFIKRVIGLPNETIVIVDGKITIKTKENGLGFELSEPYVKNESHETMTVTLGSDEYFAMGDNRRNSLDSRAWGPLPKENIIGRTLLRLFPVSDASIFPGKVTAEK